MHFTNTTRPDDHDHHHGVVERGFILDDIPGILWTPEPSAASAPLPLILLGHPGGLDRMRPRLVARATQAAAQGFAAATIELPGSGERPPSPDAEQARAELRAR
ncbi:alpha/beta hydrolase, partial [Agromyces binzhouensis]